MSLINDALKRVSRTPAAPSASTDPQSPLQPAEYKTSSHWTLVLGLVAALVVFAGGWFLVKGWQAQRAAKLAQVKPIEAREVPPDEPKAIPEIKSASATNAVADTNAVEAAKPAFPVLKLQGVFYRLRNPSVVINKKTYLVGQQVEGAKVVAISRESVTVEWNGERKVLTLE